MSNSFDSCLFFETCNMDEFDSGDFIIALIKEIASVVGNLIILSY